MDDSNTKLPSLRSDSVLKVDLFGREHHYLFYNEKVYFIPCKIGVSDIGSSIKGCWFPKDKFLKVIISNMTTWLIEDKYYFEFLLHRKGKPHIKIEEKVEIFSLRKYLILIHML